MSNIFVICLPQANTMRVEHTNTTYKHTHVFSNTRLSEEQHAVAVGLEFPEHVVQLLQFAAIPLQQPLVGEVKLRANLQKERRVRFRQQRSTANEVKSENKTNALWRTQKKPTHGGTSNSHKTNKTRISTEQGKLQRSYETQITSKTKQRNTI